MRSDICILFQISPFSPPFFMQGYGHMARECPSAVHVGQDGRSIKCYKCGKIGTTPLSPNRILKYKNRFLLVLKGILVSYDD